MMLGSDMRVVVLTGAGISAESGIRTFRANDGVWENHRIEDVATPFAWERDPRLVWRFYQGRRRQLLDVNPNSAHEALVSLESYLDEFLLITQNVDDLHSRAGSEKLIHMHGELRKLRCEMCGEIIDAMDDEHLQDQYVKCVQCTNERLRPHIVWFHEMPLRMDEIYDAVGECDVFIAIGTSGHVYPAAGLLSIAKDTGAHCIGINLDPPENVILFDEFHQGLAGELVPALVTKWMSE
ncbi:MAG: NAD-dependent deacylase [Candidatus Thermoplasmatota archaeon]|nr:NAD-dependent protein deacylase [Euryarchaeota archaeon]MEC7142355.1 NAD-dependent deacylase [Candidatus Thermoplasmatota archaeon]MEC7391639.1 NAD-dependent deacylase [Candidatus Thermoplasmatota archaeon]MEC7688070.1 NAD-dependent deacylase [Candidatus Thermoplasmatota archaeon]MEC8385229.1 NAD-dependent deacylase [Candidatus Thermoplasmatota archaeon]